MRIEEYTKLAQLEKLYFWSIGRREIFYEALSRNLRAQKNNTILDIGCGPGGNTVLLREFGAVTGLDISDEALKFAKNQDFTNLVQADATNLPFLDSSFDIISSLDALEHISGDEEVIKGAFRVLKPGGIFLVAVPAYQWLWSQHDEALQHVRRYSKEEILKKLNKAGFEILEKSHFVMLAVPITLLRKLRDKLIFKVVKNNNKKTYDIVFPKPINATLLFMMRCEKFLLRFISLPFGTSIMVVARKPSR